MTLKWIHSIIIWIFPPCVNSCSWPTITVTVTAFCCFSFLFLNLIEMLSVQILICTEHISRKHPASRCWCFAPNELTWLCVNECSMPTQRNTRQWLIQSSDVNRSLPHCQLRPSNHWHSQWVKVYSHLHQRQVSNIHGQFVGHQVYQYLNSSFLEDFTSQNVFLSACYLAGWTNTLCSVLPLRLTVELHL